MSIKSRTTILLICFLVLTGHFIILTTYLIKPGTLNSWYIYPYFHQSWGLFVPPPNKNYHLYYANRDYKIQGDILSSIITSRPYNSLNGKELFLIALTNSLFYFEQQAKENNINQGKIDHNQNLKMLEIFTKNYLYHSGMKDTSGIKLIIYIKDINNTTERVYYN